ncbi:MAG: hypothetical protein J6Y85_04435 [Alphaproteobacteria bacterium]|nr:hypothetical protein [Alphaproteobacteria bacterium]
MTTLSMATLIVCIITGILIGIAYEYLLWLSIKTLPKIKHKGLWLLFTTAARLFLLLFTAVVMAKENVARFLWIIFAFLVTRWIVINIAKNIKRKA